MNQSRLHCPNGHPLPPGKDTSRFCAICGAPMVVTCSHGHEVKPAAYCSICGVPLPPTGLSAAERKHPEDSAQQNAPPARVPSGHKHNRLLLFIAAAALLTLLIGGGAYWGIAQRTGGDSGVPVNTVPPAPATSETFSPPPSEESPSFSPTSSSPTPTSSPTAGGPEETVEAYFDAINAGDYERAWELGGKNIQPGPYSSFVQGFEDTASDSVTIISTEGESVEVELDATQTDGTHRYFAGTYTVRNGVIVTADIQLQ